MQTMPSKNRTSMAVAGIALLALVVGLIAYGVNQRNKQEIAEIDPMTELAEPENGNLATPAAEAETASTPIGGALVEAAPATEEAAMTAAPEESAELTGQETTSALATLEAVPETHVVQPGETLSTISMKYYNNHVYAGDIEQLNDISDPDMIQPGQELALPRPDSLMAVGQ